MNMPSCTSDPKLGIMLKHADENPSCSKSGCWDHPQTAPWLTPMVLVEPLRRHVTESDAGANPAQHQTKPDHWQNQYITHTLGVRMKEVPHPIPWHHALVQHLLGKGGRFGIDN
eukprot:CAMPEP_0202883262 /NCGR_PEP_ID=MMETSP1391-20130828/39220_1 /ASSEMBLY_ACC=CAM_ASM_000867 /TAXON_ID=1034604 /ORGANISM="Chlamydomonas leiostraca, Strain SAG 11-49" /LENGTH=113 /DNA_ID=CAMNT_0049566253 /DNA_START=283 /DNA_END=625 /DNA_ORIENTATION=-